MTNPIPPYALFARQVFARPALAALVDDPDAWQTLLDAHRRATEALADLSPLPAVDVAREVDHALRTGEPIPADFAERRIQADRATEIRGIKKTTLERLANGYGSELISIAEASTDEMLAGLDAELREVIGRAAELLTVLGGTADPVAAIRAGQADAFSELATLHQTYRRIRSDADVVHRQVDAAVINSDHGQHRLMRHVAGVWPAWWDAANEAPALPGWTLDRSAPWPSDPDSLEFFVWLVSHRDEVHPWIPAIQALRDAASHDSSAAYAEYQERHRVTA